MNAKKCDVCGGYYQPTGKGNNAIKIFNTFSLEGLRRIYDLCPDCIDSLEEFMNIKKEQEDEE